MKRIYSALLAIVLLTLACSAPSLPPTHQDTDTTYKRAVFHHVSAWDFDVVQKRCGACE